MQQEQSFSYYGRELPCVGDIVIGRIVNVTEIGSECILPEFSDVLAYLPHTELTKKRNMAVSRVIRLGKEYPFCVARVDNQKKFVDLSKLGIDDLESKIASSRFKNAKKIREFILEFDENNFKENYQKFAIDNYEKDLEPLDVFRKLASEPTNPFSEFCKQKLAPKLHKFTCEISVSSFEFGVDEIKKTLMMAKSFYPNVNIKLIASPIWSLEVFSTKEKLANVVLKGFVLKMMENPKTIVSFGNGKTNGGNDGKEVVESFLSDINSKSFAKIHEFMVNDTAKTFLCRLRYLSFVDERFAGVIDGIKTAELSENVLVWDGVVCDVGEDVFAITREKTTRKTTDLTEATEILVELLN